MKSVEAPQNVIQQTKDYEKFSFLEANRDKTHKHVEALKDSIARNPELIQAQPILVNEKLEIIDGQHRFEACVELDIPVYYMVVPGLTINEARTLNITQKAWKLPDFARSWALPPNNNPHYKKIMQLHEDFGLPYSILIAYALGGEKRGANGAFRRGQFVIEDYEATVERLDKLAETGKFVEQVNDNVYARALLKVMMTENYNHKHMLKKLEMHAGAMLKRYANVPDYLRVLEDIYNRQIAEQNRIRVW